MADKKSGWEKAAEAQEEKVAPPRKAVEVTTNAGAAHDIVTGEPPRKKAKKSPRKASKDVLAINRIEAICDELDQLQAMEVLRYCYNKQKNRPYLPIKDNGKALDPRDPGGPLYTPPFPELADRDHG